MKKLLIGLVLLLALIPAVAFANGVNRSPDATFPHSSELNHPEYWGDNCVKYESGFDGSVGHLPAGYSLLVLKAGQKNFVWSNPPAGDYGTPDFKDISHSIVCRGEFYEPCSDTTGWIAQESTQRTLPNGDVITSTVYLKFDAEDNGLVCARRVELEREEYEVCSQVGEWIPFGEPTQRELANGDIITSQVYVQLDAIDGETVCNRRVLLDREEYPACEGETYTVWGEWSAFSGKPGKNQTRHQRGIVYDAKTDEPCAEVERTDSKCESVSVGYLFKGIGPNGEVGWHASYQRWSDVGLDGPGEWIPPNSTAWQTCHGFIPVSLPDGRVIVRTCPSGEPNIKTVKCMGGAPCSDLYQE